MIRSWLVLSVGLLVVGLDLRADPLVGLPPDVTNAAVEQARERLTALVVDLETSPALGSPGGDVHLTGFLGSGGQGDVFEGDLDGERVAVKLYRPSRRSDRWFRVGFSVHRVLGELGVAPRVFGYLGPADLRHLRLPAAGNDGSPRDPGDYVVGVVQQFVDARITLKKYLNSEMRCSRIEKDLEGRPIAFSAPSPETLSRSYAQLFASLGLVVGDLDAFLTTDGRIVIFDFDLYGVLIDGDVHSLRGVERDPFPPGPDRGEQADSHSSFESRAREINGRIMLRFQEVLRCLHYLARRAHRAPSR